MSSGRASSTRMLQPSVEAILHAILPHRFVDHTHAEAFLAVANTPHRG